MLETDLRFMKFKTIAGVYKPPKISIIPTSLPSSLIFMNSNLLKEKKKFEFQDLIKIFELNEKEFKKRDTHIKTLFYRTLHLNK